MSTGQDLFMCSTLILACNSGGPKTRKCFSIWCRNYNLIEVRPCTEILSRNMWSYPGESDMKFGISWGWCKVWHDLVSSWTSVHIQKCLQTSTQSRGNKKSLHFTRKFEVWSDRKIGCCTCNLWHFWIISHQNYRFRSVWIFPPRLDRSFLFRSQINLRHLKVEGFQSSCRRRTSKSISLLRSGLTCTSKNLCKSYKHWKLLRFSKLLWRFSIDI